VVAIDHDERVLVLDGAHHLLDVEDEAGIEEHVTHEDEIPISFSGTLGKPIGE